jgi:hypothetical protein
LRHAGGNDARQGLPEEIVKIIADATGLPTSTSIRSAIRALACPRWERRGTVYPEELHRSALTFREARLQRRRSSHDGCRFQTMPDVTPAQIAKAAERLLASPSAEDSISLQSVVRCRLRA